MTDADRYRLLKGPYRTPRWRSGRVVMDEVRGEVTVVGLTAGRIPWPVGKRGRAKAPVVAAGPAQAANPSADRGHDHGRGPAITVGVATSLVPQPTSSNARFKIRILTPSAFRRGGARIA